MLYLENKPWKNLADLFTPEKDSDGGDVNLCTWGRHFSCPLSIGYEKVDNSYGHVMILNQFPVTKCQNDLSDKRKNNSGLIEHDSPVVR